MFEELLKYQEADGKLRAIEQEIASTDERKKYMSARKFLEKAPEKLEQLETKALEFHHLFEQLQVKYKEIIDTLHDYEHVDEMIGEQGGEIAFYKKNATQISDNLRALEAEIKKLSEMIKDTSAEYKAAKKQTIVMQRQYKEYKVKYQEIKQSHEEEVQSIKREMSGIEKKVPATQIEKYNLKRRERLYPVVCEVKANGDRCPQCGMEFSLAEVSKLDAGELIECDSCRRILFKTK